MVRSAVKSLKNQIVRRSGSASLNTICFVSFGFVLLFVDPFLETLRIPEHGFVSRKALRRWFSALIFVAVASKTEICRGCNIIVGTGGP